MLSFDEERKEEGFKERLQASWRQLSERQKVALEEMIVRTAELNRVSRSFLQSTTDGATDAPATA